MHEIALPDTKASDEKALSAVDKARQLSILTPTDYTVADTFCVGLKELEKEIVGTFKDPKEKAWAAHKSIVAAEAKHLEPIQEARRLIKQKMSAWQELEDQKRREEEARLQAEANKRAEEEALKAADEAQKAGDTATAEAILSAPVEAPPVVLPKSTPQAKTVIRTTWSYRIVNANLLPREYLIPDTVKLGGMARATKGSVKVPGVEFFQQKV